MNKSILGGAVVLLVIGALGIFVFSNNGDANNLTGNVISQNSDGLLTINLVSDDSGQYSPSEIKASLGQQIRIVGDSKTLVGGMDTVVIEGYEIRKKISSSSNIIEFTADKKGEFDVVCANGMGNAKLIVA